MTEPGVVIHAEDVHVTYRLYADRRPTLRETLSLRRASREHVVVEAVRGVSFDIRAGEVVGLVGPNGSGKSTLLRTIAGLQPVTSGTMLVSGDPTLLGVGAVLDSHMSGARNVLLGCMAQGMSRQEAEQHFDEIVEFAGVRHAIDRPLRTYSSGMRARLMFGISTAVMPDILLIDETLAVGDRAFKQRSVDRIAALQDQASVVILVAHNLKQVRTACNRVIWLEDGKIVLDGKPGKVVRAYKESTE